MPMLPNQWSNSVAQVSLATPVIAPEHYEELWWYSDGGTFSSGGVFYLAKGAAATANAPTLTSNTAKILYTLNSNWNPNTKFAFEVAIQTGSAYPTTVSLYDVNAGVIVSASSVTCTGVTSMFRSGQFTLTPGHSYGIQSSNGYSGYTLTVTDASLIIFS